VGDRPRHRLLVKRLDLRHEPPHREVLLGPAHAGIPHPARQVAILEEPQHRRRERFRIGWRNEDPGHFVDNRLRHAADRCCNHGFRARHRFEHCQRQSFVERRQHDDVGRAEDVGDVGSESEEGHAIANAELAGQ